MLMNGQSRPELLQALDKKYEGSGVYVTCKQVNMLGMGPRQHPSDAQVNTEHSKERKKIWMKSQKCNAIALCMCTCIVERAAVYKNLLMGGRHLLIGAKEVKWQSSQSLLSQDYCHVKAIGVLSLLCSKWEELPCWEGQESCHSYRLPLKGDDGLNVDVISVVSIICSLCFRHDGKAKESRLSQAWSQGN